MFLSLSAPASPNTHTHTRTVNGHSHPRLLTPLGILSLRNARPPARPMTDLPLICPLLNPLPLPPLPLLPSLLMLPLLLLIYCFARSATCARKHQGRHSTKKDDFLWDLVMQPPKQRIPIEPFNLSNEKMKEGFNVSSEGLKGVSLIFLLACVVVVSCSRLLFHAGVFSLASVILSHLTSLSLCFSDVLPFRCVTPAHPPSILDPPLSTFNPSLSLLRVHCIFIFIFSNLFHLLPISPIHRANHPSCPPSQWNIHLLFPLFPVFAGL